MTESLLRVATERVRVTEWRLPSGDATGHHTHEYDYVVVPLTGGELTIVDPAGNPVFRQEAQPFYRIPGIPIPVGLIP